MISQKSPFKFLESYSKEDRDIFFGRDREIEELYQRVFENRILLVYGVSGTGKSSLIHCGLANKFSETDWLPLVIRRGSNITENMAFAIKTASVTPQQSKFIGPAGFKKGVRSLYLDHYKPIYFIFDQFEELFIFGNREERVSFINIVKTLINSDLQCRLIFLMREEYMACVTEFEKVIPTIFTNRVRIEKMSHINALETIKGPCKVNNIRLEEGFAESLLEKLSPESNDVELTYLQVFLDKIFRFATNNIPPPGGEQKGGSSNLPEQKGGESSIPEHDRGITFTLEMLDRTGNVSDLLGSFLDEQIALLNNPDEALTVLKSFVSIKGTRRQMSPEEVIAYSLTLGRIVDEKKIQDILQAFISLRILNDKDQNGKYELRHDALAIKIYEKITLIEKEILEIRQFIDNAYNNWRKRGVVLYAEDLNYIAPYESRLYLPDDFNNFIEESKKTLTRAKRRKRNFALIAAIALLITFAGFTIWALKERTTALNQSKHSRALSLAAEARETFSVNPTKAVRLAELAFKYDSSNYIVNQTLNESFHNTASNPVFNASLTHNDQVFTSAFSPDGTKILTASKDETAKMWDLSGNCIATYTGHRGGVNGAIFSPDGKMILTSSADQTAKLWELSGKCLVTFVGHNGEVLGVAFSPDGNMVLTFCSDRTAKIWNLSGKCLATLAGHTDIIESAVFSPDGKNIITSSDDMTARLWDLSGKCLTIFKGHTAKSFSSLFSARFSPDGKLIVTASVDETAKLWNLSGECLATLEGHYGSVYSACFSPDGRTILTSSFDNYAKLWDLKGNCLVTLNGHSDAIYEACFSPDGYNILTASADKTAKIWDISGNCLLTLSGHSLDLYTAAFSPDGKKIVTASADKTAKLWDLSRKFNTTLSGHNESVWSAIFSNNGNYILTSSNDSTGKLWDCNGKYIVTLSGHKNLIYTALFSPDDNMIVTASPDRTAKVWDINGNCILTLTGHTDNVSNARFSPDGQKILTTSRDMTAKLWDLSGKCLSTLTGHTDGVLTAAFSTDGNTIITASADNTAKLWDREGHCLTTLNGHFGPVGYVSFSNDGRSVLTASFDRTAKLWDLSGKCLATFTGHSEPVYSAIFSPDCKTILTCSMDRTAKLWDLSGKCLVSFTGHTHDVLFAGFSPDGKTVLTSSADKTAKIWDLTGKCLITLTGHTGEVYTARFSPDGERIVTASADKTARIWHTQQSILQWLRSSQFGGLAPSEMSEVEEPVDFRTLSGSVNSTKLTEYADWYLGQADTSKAEILYEKALQLNPNSFDREILGNIYKKEGKNDKYLKLFRDEPEMVIKDELFLMSDTTADENIPGKFYYYTSRAALFERLLKVENDPGDKINAARNYVNIAWFGLLSGRYPAALDAVRRGISLDPQNEYLFTNLPLCLLFTGQVDEAYKTYNDWRDQPWTADSRFPTFREAFLSDIGYLESIGLINPGFAQAKESLMK